MPLLPGQALELHPQSPPSQAPTHAASPLTVILGAPGPTVEGGGENEGRRCSRAEGAGSWVQAGSGGAGSWVQAESDGGGLGGPQVPQFAGRWARPSGRYAAAQPQASLALTSHATGPQNPGSCCEGQLQGAAEGMAHLPLLVGTSPLHVRQSEPQIRNTDPFTTSIKLLSPHELASRPPPPQDTQGESSCVKHSCILLVWRFWPCVKCDSLVK